MVFVVTGTLSAQVETSSVGGNTIWTYVKWSLSIGVVAGLLASITLVEGRKLSILSVQKMVENAANLR